MKGMLGLVGLLLTLVIVGFLVKKQLAASQQIAPALQVPITTGVQSSPAAPATVGEQSRQIQQQVKQAVEGALQQPRTVADEK